MVKFYLLLGALLFPVLLKAQPVVTGLSPAANVHNAPLTGPIRISFSQPMAAAGEASFSVHGSLSGRIKGSYDGGGTATLSFQPQASFKAGELVTVTLTTGTGSTGGVALAKPYVYSFRAQAATAPVTFGPQQHLNTSGPLQMMTADLDGDGDIDIASTGSLFSGTGVTLHLNNGAGIYTATKTVPLEFITSLCLADFNGDGYVDICATGGRSPHEGPYIFFNDGRGNFTASLKVPFEGLTSDMKAGDLNGDGALDLAFGSRDSLFVALNQGNGSFTPPGKWKLHDPSPRNVSLLDIDLDGDTDIAVSVGFAGRHIQVFYNDGTGGFFDLKLVSGVAYNMAIGDLDRDGDLDLVSPLGRGESQAVIYKNDGAGTLNLTKIEDLGPNPTFAELADMDGDNDLDIIFVRWSDFVSVMLNASSDGLFYTPTPLVVVGNSRPGAYANPSVVNAVDLDGDLDLDLVTANSGNATLSVLLNGGTQPVISPLSLAYPAEGGSNSGSVSYPGSWSVSSSESWLTVTPSSSSGKASFTATAQTNPLARERTATLTVTGGGASRTLSVTQASALPTLGEVMPRLLSFAYYGGSSQVSITSNAATTVTAQQDWLSISFASGFGDRTFYVGANLNPTGYSRTGKVVVSTGSLHDTLTVTQQAHPPTISGTISAPIAQGGGSATLTIESNTNWKITNPGDWFSFSPSSGSGNATVTVTALANESVYTKALALILSAGETGSSLKVNSEPVMVYQYGVPLVFEVRPTENIFWGADAQTASFTVTTNANWVVTSERPWLSLSPAAGTGNGTVTFSAPANTGTTNRTTIVRVTLPGLGAFKSFSVTQVSSFLAPTAVAFAAQGESKTVQVSYSGNWSLSAEPWLTISPASGSGPASVTLTATTNPAGIVRSGKLTARYTFAGGTPTQTLSLTQQGATLAVSPATVALPASGPGSDGKVSSPVEVTSNVSWTVSSAPAWLTIDPQTGTGNATLTLTAEANPSVDGRSDSLTLTAGSLTRKVAVSQAGQPVELRTEPAALHFEAGGGNQTVEVLCNTDWQVAGALPGWLQANTTSGRGNGNLTLSASMNPTLQARTHTLTLTARGETINLSVSQEAAQPSLAIAADTLLFVAEGESKSLAVTTNVPWTISDLPSVETWYSVTTSGVTTSGGEGSATLSITAKANPDTSSRTASLTLSGGGLSRRLTLLQPGTPAYLTVSADSLNLSAEGQESTLYIASNLSWQISGVAPWLTVDPLTGKGSSTVGLSAPANENAEPRSCTLTVTAGNFTRRVVVSQSPKPGTVPTPVPGPELVLAPNPAHHLLKLTIGQQTGTLLPVGLYNSIGQSVAFYTLPVVEGQVETVLQVAHLPRGLYVLQVHTATGLQRVKLLLQ